MIERDIDQELKQLDELLKTIRADLDKYGRSDSTKKIFEAQLTEYQDAVDDLKTNPNQTDHEDLVNKAAKTLNEFKAEVRLRAAVANLENAGEKLENNNSFTNNRLKSEIESMKKSTNIFLDQQKGNIYLLEAEKQRAENLTREIQSLTQPQRASTRAVNTDTTPDNTAQSKRRSIIQVSGNAVKRLSTSLSPAAIGKSLSNFTDKLPSAKDILGAAARAFKNLPITPLVSITSAVTNAANKTVDTARGLASSSANLMKAMLSTATNFLSNLPLRSASKIGSDLASAANKTVDTIKSITSAIADRLPSFKRDAQTSDEKNQKSTQAQLLEKLVIERAETKKDLPTTNPNEKVTISADKVNELFELLQNEANKPEPNAKTATQNSTSTASQTARNTNDATANATNAAGQTNTARPQWTSQGTATKTAATKEQHAEPGESPKGPRGP